MATLNSLPFPLPPSPAGPPSSNLPLPSVREYFDCPACTDANADVAYQNYLRQSPDRGHDFSHWLEVEAWHLTSRSS